MTTMKKENLKPKPKPRERLIPLRIILAEARAKLRPKSHRPLPKVSRRTKGKWTILVYKSRSDIKNILNRYRKANGIKYQVQRGKLTKVH